MNNKNVFEEGEITTIVEMWPRYTISEIAEKCKRSRFSILQLAKRIREEGYDLPHKNLKDVLSAKIKRAMEKSKYHFGKIKNVGKDKN